MLQYICNLHLGGYTMKKEMSVSELRSYLDPEDRKTLDALVNKATRLAAQALIEAEIARLQEELAQLENIETPDDSLAEYCDDPSLTSQTPPLPKTTSTQAKIGEFVKLHVRALLESGTLSQTEIQLLQTADYSKRVLDINYPLLGHQVRDHYGRNRYYATRININGDYYYLCSQWYDHHYPIVKRWLDAHSWKY